MNYLDPSASLADILRYAVAVIVFLSVILAILYSLWGGFLIITSWGNEEKVKPAVNHIRHAFLWLIVLVIILFVLPKVLDIFGLPYGNSLSPGAIFDSIREISANLFGGGSSSSSKLLDDGSSLDALPSDFSDL
jgi:hypothetical protein